MIFLNNFDKQEILISIIQSSNVYIENNDINILTTKDWT